MDVSYLDINDKTIGFCSVVVIDNKTKEIIEKVSLSEEIKFKYIPNFLSFRELPITLKTIKKLRVNPDLYMFDGNGYLHKNHMGIATHASIYLKKPTIGVAKSYLKINETDFINPENNVNSFSDIIINNETYGRALRTKENVKPIFISCGNYITLDSCMKIVLDNINNESRIAIPTRLADIETHILRKQFLENNK